MILFIVFIDLLGFGLILPQLPFLAQNMGASAFEIGLLGAAFPLMQIIFMSFWGKLFDIWKEKNIFLISLLGTFLAYLLYANSQQFIFLLLSRLIAGATSANLGVAKAVLTHPEDAKLTHRNMGRYGTAMALGFLIGPVLGSFLMKVNLNFPAYFAAAITLISFLMILFKYKNVSSPNSKNKIYLGWMQNLKKSKNVIKPLWIYFFLNQAFASLYISFPLIIQKKFGFESEQTGYYFILIALLAVLTQGFIFPRIRINSPQKFLGYLILFLAICTGTIPYIQSNTMMVGIVSLWVCLFSLALPTILAIIGNRSLENSKGAISGLSESVNGIARFSGSLLIGLLITKAGFEAAFIFIAVCLFIGMYLALSLRSSNS